MRNDSHRAVQRLLNDTKNSVTDKQFFTARAFSLALEDIAAAQTSRFKPKNRIRVIVVWKPRSDMTARTDGNLIFINAAYPGFRGLNREQRYVRVLAFFSHELGHVLFTDFTEVKKHLTAFLSGNWHPKAPDLSDPVAKGNASAPFSWIASLDTLTSDSKEVRVKIFSRIIRNLHNIIEDAHIEDLILKAYPGTLGQTLEIDRYADRKEMQSLSDLLKRRDEGDLLDYHIMTRLVLNYGKWGDFKYGDAERSEPCIQKLYNILDILDEAVNQYKAVYRSMAVNAILVEFWPEIHQAIECFAAEYEERRSKDPNTDLNKLLDKNQVGTPEGTGGEPLAGFFPGENTSATPRSGDRVSKDTKGSANKKGAEESASPSGDATSLACPKTDPDTHSENASDKSAESLQVTPEEGCRFSLQEGRATAVAGVGGIEYDDSYEPEPYAGAATDIQRILTAVAEERLEEAHCEALQRESNEIDYGQIHQGVLISIKREAVVSLEEMYQYREVAAPLLQISKQLQKQILNAINDRRNGAKINGLVYGRRLEGHRIYRRDGKVFSKKSLPNEEPIMAVSLLVDESGSMNYSDRASYARAAAIILQDFCAALNIPFCCMGHTSDTIKSWTDTDVQLFSYADFTSVDKNDKYRLMAIRPRHNNRDGAALRFVGEHLAKRPEKTKLLLIISDGQPMSMQYHGLEAEKDLKQIQQELRRKGITLIAAAIGSDKKAIHRIYGDAFLDISDLNRLPVALTQLVKRMIRL